MFRNVLLSDRAILLLKVIHYLFFEISGGHFSRPSLARYQNYLKYPTFRTIFVV